MPAQRVKPIDAVIRVIPETIPASAVLWRTFEAGVSAVMDDIIAGLTSR